MQSRDRYRIAVLAAYALALHGFESLIPSPVPWFRLGLSNIITVLTLVLFGFRSALMVTLVRVVTASVITGTFLGPSFFLSLGGSLLGACSMGIAARLCGGLFGTIGYSLIGAFFHNMGQLLVAWLLIVQRFEAVIVVAPLLVFIGALTGFFNGAVAEALIRLLKKDEANIQNVV